MSWLGGAGGGGAVAPGPGPAARRERAVRWREPAARPARRARRGGPENPPEARPRALPDRRRSRAGSMSTTPRPTRSPPGAVKEDPLKIGGLFYTRGFLTALQNQPFNRSPVSFPTLVDVYLDARPHGPLRAFVLGRLTLRPVHRDTVGGTALPGVPRRRRRATRRWCWTRRGSPSTSPGRVFVTVGRQHVKWGVARFFTPTDFLASQPRRPARAVRRAARGDHGPRADPLGERGLELHRGGALRAHPERRRRVLGERRRWRTPATRA